MMGSIKSKSVMVLFSLFFISPLFLSADWVDDGTGICTAVENQEAPQIVYSGSEAIITWADNRNGNWDIYAQKIDADGNIQWTPNGVVICTEAHDQKSPQIVPDGSFGAIIAWTDYRGTGGTSDIYIQKIDGNGNVQWEANGRPVVVQNEDQEKPQLAKVTGGVIITWEDWRNEYSNIYAQWINTTDGTVKWQTNGVCIGAIHSYEPKIGEVNGSEAIIVFSRYFYGNYYIYAQKVDTEGNTQWAEDGVPVFEYANWYSNYQLVTYCGNAIVVSERYANARTSIHAQRISSTGGRLWMSSPNDGICDYACDFDQKKPQLTWVDNGNVIVVYEDYRSGCHIYAQKLLYESGAKAWSDGGIPISTLSGSSYQPQIIQTGINCAIISWYGYPENTIYAQMINQNGSALWLSGGLPICTAVGEQKSPQLASNYSGSTFITWEDKRANYGDIYASKLIPEMACTITWEAVSAALGTPTGKDTVVGCPAGDIDALKLTLDFNEAVLDMYYIDKSVESTKITLDKSAGSITLWKNGNIYADGPADPPYYITTITHPYIGGCSVCPSCTPPDIPVRVDGIRIGWATSIKVSSPDMNNDGYVNLSDLGLFGNTYNKPPIHPNFTLCGDFNLDGLVNLSDQAIFGSHYQHYYPY